MERIYSFFHKSPDAMLFFDSKGLIILANEPAQELYGYSLEELAQKTIFELDLRDAPQVVTKLSVAAGAGSLYETIHLTKNGEKIRVVMSCISTILNGKKGYLGSIYKAKMQSSVNRLLQKRIKQKLSVPAFSRKAKGDAIILADLSGKIVYINKKAQSLTKWKEKDALGRNAENVFASDRVAKIKGIYKGSLLKALKALTPPEFSGKVVLTTKTGRKLSVSHTTTLIEIEGKPGGILIVFRDLSEDSKVQSELRKSERRYRVMFENTGTAMVIVEADTKISHANKQMEILSGYSRAEIENRMSFLDFVAEHDRKRMLRYHQSRRKAGSPTEAPRTYEFDFLALNNQEKVVLCTVEVMPETNQSVASFLDITERKKAEAKARYLSYYDQVTGIFNRRYAEKIIADLDYERVLPVAFIMGDINGLKLINDAFGHEAGDHVLQKAAEVLKETVGKKGIVARFGGDEFVAIMKDISEEEVLEILETIKIKCENTECVKGIKLSIALGYSVNTKLGQTGKEALRDAEDKMYRQKLLETSSFHDAVISSLEETLREKNLETEAHAIRTKNLSRRLGSVIGLRENELEELELLAALHDIGKLGIPESILKKPDKLTDFEIKVMRRHPEVGYRIASSFPDLAHIAEAILAHHERWDGLGYPRGLKGEEIPITSRIIALVDAYDVMTQGRTYQTKVTKEEALDELERFGGTQFDPHLTAVLVKMLREEKDNPKFLELVP